MSPISEAIVLVGGQGTRLRSVVPDMPKPLAPVSGRPFLTILLDRLVGEGVSRIILATGYMSERIESVIGSSWRNVPVEYSVETAPLGTGGAIRMATALLRGNGAHVVNGDTFVDYSLASLEETVRTSGCAMGMVLTAVDDTSRYGEVLVEGGRVSAFREKQEFTKPGMINAGAYFLTASAIAQFADATVFSMERDFLTPMVERGAVAAFEDSGSFIDIGVPEDYFRAQELFR